MKKRVLALLLVLALTLPLLPAAAAETGEIVADGICGDDLTWTLDAAGVLTISGSGAMYDYTSHGPWYNEGYSQVIFSDEITHIGSYAFADGPSLAYTAPLNLPANLKTVGDYAFSGWCKAEELVIPDSVTYVGAHSFYNVISRSGLDGGNYGQSKELSGPLTMPAVWPEMGEYAFYSNNFTGHLSVPAGTKHIPEGAFGACTFSSLSVPEGLESIGHDAFNFSCSVTRLDLPEVLPPEVGRTVFPPLDMTHLTIPAAWTQIPFGMFQYSRLQTVELPDGLKYIGDSAFSYTDLVALDLPDGLEVIDSYAFYNCEALATVELPDTITTLGSLAFGKTALTAVPAWPEQLQLVEGYTYLSCSSLTGVGTFPPAHVSIGDGLYYESSITSAVLSDGMTEIPNWTFYGCKELHTLYVPASVTQINGSALGRSNIQTIIYEGTREDWDAIRMVEEAYGSIAETKQVIADATIRCLGTKRPEAPSDTAYNSTTAKRTFWIYDGDNTGYPLPTGFTVTVGDQTYSTGDKHYITVELSRTEPQDVVISKEGYTAYTLPAAQVGSVNTVYLYRSDKNLPYANAVLLEKAGGSSFSNLLISQEIIVPKSNLWKDRTIYVDVNWNGHGAGTIRLEQTAGKSIPLQEGGNAQLDLSNSFLSGVPVYLVLEAADGTRSEQPVKLGVQVIDPPTVSLDLGQAVTYVPTTSDNQTADVFNGDTLKLDFSKLAGGKLPVSLEIREDCTIVGTIGIKGMASGEGSSLRGTLQDALDDLHRNGSSEKMNALAENLNNSGKLADMPGGTLGIEFGATVVGTFEGYIDEDLKPVLTSVKAAFIFEGRTSYLQSFLVAAAPMYFEAGIKAALEAAILFRLGDDGKLQIPQAQPLTVTLEITVGSGFGHPDVVSGGVEGSGELKIEFQVPLQPELGTWTLSAKSAFVGSLVGTIQGEWVFWRSENMVLFRDGTLFPDGVPASVSLMTEDLARAQWVQAPRDYLDNPSAFLANRVSLMEESGPDSGVFLENLYPYNEPQIAAFGPELDRLVAVWIDDVGGTSTLPENRTRLYFSICDDGVWSEPERVSSGRKGRYAEFAPSLQVIDGNVTLTYLKASESFSGGESMETISSMLNVWTSTLEEDGFTFYSDSQLSSSDGMEMSPSVDHQDLVTAWLHTPGGPFGDNQTIVTSSRADGTVELVTGLTGVDTVSVSPDGTAVAYSTVTDGVRQVWTADVATGAAVCLGKGSKPVYAADKLWWYDNGVIRSSGADEVPAVHGSDRFQVLTAAGTTAVLTAAKNGAGLWTVYASYEAGSWSEPAPLAQVEGFLGGFSAAADSSGSIHLLLNRQTLAEDYTVQQADLLHCIAAASTELAVSDAYYDSRTLIPGGTLSASVKVENRGSRTIGPAMVRVLDGTTLLSETVMQVQAAPGTAEYLEVLCALPEQLPASLTVTVEPLLEADGNPGNNGCTLALLLQDLSVEELSAAVTDDTGTVETVVRVVNRGQTTLSAIPVGLYADTENGPVAAAAQTIGTLAPGDVAVLTFESTGLQAGQLVYAVAQTDPALENSLSNDRNFTRIRSNWIDAQPGSSSLQLYTVLQREDDGAVLTVSLENGTDKDFSGTLCAAVYEDGRFVKLARFEPVSVGAGGRLSPEPVTLPELQDHTVKVMLLDDDLAPVLPARTPE